MSPPHLASSSSGQPVPNRRPFYRLFDVLFVLAALIASTHTVDILLRPQDVMNPGFSTLANQVVAVVGNLAFVALWFGARRPGIPPLVIHAFVFLSVVVPIVSGAGSSTLPLVLLVLTFVTFRLGLRAAGADIAVVMVVLYVWMFPFLGPVTPVVELLVFGVVMAFGIVLGILLAEVDSARSTAAAMARDLAESNRKLREAMTAQRDLVLAKERSRAARDMHDGLGSRMTVVSMSLSFAQRMKDVDPEAAWDEVASAARTNAQALADMRLWVRALNPPDLIPEVGGASAFDAIAESFRGTGMKVLVSHRGDAAPLRAELSIFAQRLVQECLTNTLRHSDCQEVHIELVQDSRSIELGVLSVPPAGGTVDEDGTANEEGTVDEDGAGASPRQLPSFVEGFGLRSLRERAEALGGSMVAGYLPDGGFRVVATCPLAGEAPLSLSEGAEQ